MTPKLTAARAARHLKTIRQSAHKLAHEFMDVDSYIEHRADEFIALVDKVHDDIAYFLKEQEEKS